MGAYLGLDIAKSTFDAVLLSKTSQRHRSFDNDEDGFAALARWLGPAAADLHACMEATGGYGDDLALFLDAQGVRVSVVNPLQIKAFAQSELIRTKTDKVDAGVIARFCRSHDPAPWQVPSPHLRALRALIRRCAALKEMRAKELQRLSCATPSPLVRRSVERTIAWLDAEITDIAEAAADLIRSDEALHRAHRLITSIPGMGDQSAAVLLAEIPDFRAFGHNKQITAFAGLDPRETQSGSSVRGRSRISKIGHARLRATLYMCALSARRYNPTIRAFADRLAEAGKAPKLILVAVARKLLILVYGVLKSGKPFQPTLT